MPEQHDVKILQWPKTKAKLEHHFELDKPCPVAIVFEEKPAMVNVTSNPETPVHMKMDMDMDMNVRAREPFPVCIKICDPICAVSDYEVGIKLLGQPLIQIGVKGTTKLSDCKDNSPGRERCTDFKGNSEKDRIDPPLIVDGLRFSPMGEGGQIRFTRLAPNPTPIQLGFTNGGMRIEFPLPVSGVSLSLVNYGNSIMELAAFDAGVAVYNGTTAVEGGPTEVNIPVARLTALTVKGGSNEAALVELCYTPSTNVPEPKRPAAPPKPSTPVVIQ